MGDDRPEQPSQHHEGQQAASPKHLRHGSTPRREIPEGCGHQANRLLHRDAAFPSPVHRRSRGPPGRRRAARVRPRGPTWYRGVYPDTGSPAYQAEQRQRAPERLVRKWDARLQVAITPQAIAKARACLLACRRHSPGMSRRTTSAAAQAANEQAQPARCRSVGPSGCFRAHIGPAYYL